MDQGSSGARMRTLLVMLAILASAGLGWVAAIKLVQQPVVRTVVRPLEVSSKCNPLQVGTVEVGAMNPPQMYVVCLALAGQLEQADHMLSFFEPAQQAWVTSNLFTLAHAVADAGDDAAAAPIMKLVVKWAPTNLQAAYHAGLAEFRAGRDGEARRYLTQFVEGYRVEDRWRERAVAALRDLDRGLAFSERTVAGDPR
jgi:hypothetical protein